MVKQVNTNPFTALYFHSRWSHLAKLQNCSISRILILKGKHNHCNIWQFNSSHPRGSIPDTNIIKLESYTYMNIWYLISWSQQTGIYNHPTPDIILPTNKQQIRTVKQSSTIESSQFITNLELHLSIVYPTKRDPWSLFGPCLSPLL